MAVKPFDDKPKKPGIGTTKPGIGTTKPGQKTYGAERPTTSAKPAPAKPAPAKPAPATTGNSQTVAATNEFAAQVQAVGGFSDQGYVHSKRWVRFPGGLQYGSREVFTDAPGRVDVFGNLLPGYYDLDLDPRKTYGSLDPAARKRLTESLISAGFLDPDYASDFSSNIAALTEAMDESNVLGLELDNWLQQKASSSPRRTTGGATRTYSTTNTQDLVRIVNQVAQDTIGRKLTDEEASRFAQQYQSQEVSFQKAAYGGGTVMQAPSLETSAMSFIQQARPKEEAGYKYLGYMNQLFDAIGTI